MGRILILLLALTVVVAVAQLTKREPVGVQLADKFLSSLSPEQRAKAEKTFSDDYRKNWRFVPATREGINLGDLTPAQSILAADLLKSALSGQGFKKIETIKSLEDVLFELEGGNKGRDKRLYTFTFFGRPSLTEPWAWRYEGHHVSLNFTYRKGVLVSSTPQFLGANPAEVRSGPHKGLVALPEEQDMAFALLDTFSPEQLGKAVIGSMSPAEIITSNARKVGMQDHSGITYSELTPKQRRQLTALIKLHAACQATEEYRRRLDRVNYETVSFAWMGATKPGKGHYYRIQGSKFLIEFDNTQNNANHIHAVWRDFDGDFGEDVLAEHYAASKHQP